MNVGRLYFPFGMVYFQGLLVKLPGGIPYPSIPLDPVPVAMVPLNLVFTVLVEGISDRYGKVENSLDGLVFRCFLGGEFWGGD